MLHIILEQLNIRLTLKSRGADVEVYIIKYYMNINKFPRGIPKQFSRHSTTNDTLSPTYPWPESDFTDITSSPDYDLDGPWTNPLVTLAVATMVLR
jgi:hypothetical protein